MATEPTRNVFVLGLNEFQRGELETITNAHSIEFHQLLSPETVLRPDEHGFAELLARARAQLEEFEGSIDGIIAHWDFPTSVLVPLLVPQYELPGPTLRAVLACEHKLWSRREQRRCIPEVVPDFAAIDPFSDDPLEGVELDFPFWLKPVKAHSSRLGFKIDTPDDLHAAIPAIREGIGMAGEPFNEVLALAELPEGISPTSGMLCIAEQIVTGVQATVEGTMFQGEFSVHGVVESPKDESSKHFSRYEYPASLPDEVQARMIDVCERFLRHIEYDDSAWNIEFMWDEEPDQLWLVEVNTRISQSHSDLFAKVDGMSNHEVAVDVVLGSRPMMPDRRGNFAVAGKCFLWTEEMDDGIVRRVPSQQEIDAVVERFPGTRVVIEVEPGERLAELRDQSSYRYDLGYMFIGAQDRDELIDRYEACREMLPFEFDPVD